PGHRSVFSARRPRSRSRRCVNGELQALDAVFALIPSGAADARALLVAAIHARGRAALGADVVAAVADLGARAAALPGAPRELMALYGRRTTHVSEGEASFEAFANGRLAAVPRPEDRRVITWLARRSAVLALWRTAPTDVVPWPEVDVVIARARACT